MVNAPVKRLILELSAPTIVTMLISALYNMADTFFVSTINMQATAAVGVTFAFMSLVQAAGFFYGQGAGNVVSRALGGRDEDNAAKTAATGTFLAIATGVVIAAVCFVAAAPFARLLGASDSVIDYTVAYLRPLCFSVPFSVASFVLNNLLRFQGSAVFGMVGMVTGCVINVSLDWLFISVLHTGIEGAAYATVAGTVVSTLLLFLGCARSGNVKIDFRKITLSKHVLSEIAKGGAPSLFRQVLMGVSVLVLNNLATKTGRQYGLGDSVTAAMTVVNRVTWLMQAAILGFGQGYQPVCGFNYGAGKYDRVKQGFRFCVVLSTAVTSVMAVVLFIFAPQAVSVFRNEPDIVNIGAFALRAVCITAPILPWTMLSSFLLQTTERAAAASFLSLARQGLFLIPLLLMLAQTAGVRGIAAAQPIADMMIFVTTIVIMRKNRLTSAKNVV